MFTQRYLGWSKVSQGYDALLEEVNCFNIQCDVFQSICLLSVIFYYVVQLNYMFVKTTAEKITLPPEQQQQQQQHVFFFLF